MHQRGLTHCKNGHEFTPDNTMLVPRPSRNYTERVCRICHRLRERRQKRVRAGRKNDPVRQAWSDIKKRCYDPKHKSFKYYGARGISMCQHWIDSFASFRQFVGDRPTSSHEIDRIDNDGNYAPGNVRWVTHDVQMANRRPRQKKA